MAAYANNYIICDEVGNLDERKALQAVQLKHDVRAAPPGKLADFLTEMVRNQVSKEDFKLRLDLYNDEQLYASELQFLAQHGAPTPLAFKEKFGAEFIEHYIHNEPCDEEDPEGYAASMLEFLERRKGQDWTDLNGYDIHGVRLLDIMHSTVEEFEEVAQDEAEERKRPVTFTASADDLWAIAQLQMGDIEITLSQAQLKRLRAKY